MVHEILQDDQILNSPASMVTSVTGRVVVELNLEGIQERVLFANFIDFVIQLQLQHRRFRQNLPKTPVFPLSFPGASKDIVFPFSWLLKHKSDHLSQRNLNSNKDFDIVSLHRTELR